MKTKKTILSTAKNIIANRDKKLNINQLKPINKLIGAKIETLRGMLGITQKEFAKRVNLSRVSIVNIEAGKQNLNMDQIEQFSKAFGISPKHLLRGIWF